MDSTLRVNDQGCFALDNEVLFAPYGSKVSDDGKGVIFPGYGEVRVGERITGAGGSTESVPTGGQKCLDPGPGPHYFETVDPLQ